MKQMQAFPMALIALAALAGCASMPATNAQLDQARSDYRAAQQNPQTVALAGGEMKAASDALDAANAAAIAHRDQAEIDHLAYLAKQRVAIARETADQKTAEATVASSETLRDRVRLAARTSEADTAQRNAATSQRRSEASQRESEAAQRQSEASRQQALTSQQQAQASQQQAQASLQQSQDAQAKAEAAQRQADESQRMTAEANARNVELAAQLKDLNAKSTNRGLVVTLGDVLFDTDKAQLKSGGVRSVEKLGGFLKQYPQRKVVIEGFTDSTGTESLNAALSARRAEAVRAALLGSGIGNDRITTHGYGESYPVASNDSAVGRQLNRRVEIVLSDDAGNVPPR
jgi:outer membrane protein OmpA-like peptidoglycan-associated protein